ncbi:MAG: DUF11 domain-containing protein, partial [Caldilineaceae bacterium]|nr:DUF11 domain-containing protein [Caldilineaceae bacterium]
MATLLAVVAVLGLAPGVRAQDTIHVTPDGSGNGSSWASPTNLRNALSVAVSGDEIWVASGVYTPGPTATYSFTVKSGVQLYGGFAATETVRTQRDWVANPTILSGDIGGNDITVGGVVTSTASIVGTNAWHVLWLDGVVGDPITTTTVIDGFSITAGKANSTDSHQNGGGLYCAGSGSGNECSPTIANVTFSGNLAAFGGGAMYNDGFDFYDTFAKGISSPSLTNVIFSGNSAASGGAMYNYGKGGGSRATSGLSSPSLMNVTFRDNTASVNGGAMYNDAMGYGESSPSLTNVTFSGNSAANGGAMYNYGNSSGDSSPSLVNVLFSGNSATNYGGAMCNYVGFSSEGTSRPTLVNVTFSGNSASGGGAISNQGGMYGGEVKASLVNAILWGNTATSNGAQISNSSATAVISYTLVPSTTADIYGAGITWGPGNLTDGSAFTTTDIFVDAAIGNLRLAADSPAIDAGDSNALPSSVTTDLDSSIRIQGAAVDLGAYESASPALISLVKSVAPDTDVVYSRLVTYTLVFENSGTLADSSVTLTDTLPAGASFADWVEQPAGAAFTNDALTWSGAVGQAEVITFTFLATNTATTGVIITNTAWFSGSAQTGSAAAAYMTSSTLYPSGSGNWSEVYPPCSGVCKYVVPTGFTITLDLDISLAGDFEIESGGTFVPNGKTVTFTGDQPQTLTGNPLSFYNLVVNKTNKSNTVTIVGKLKVSKKLTVRSGKLISASDYGDIEIEENGELQLTSDITVSGHFTNSGTFDSDGYGVIFDGATAQRLVLNTF